MATTPYGQALATGPDAANNPISYTSRENDETGLLFYRARYYDTVLKLFISSDPIGLIGGLHTFGYVEGDPLRFTDPTGEIAVAQLIVWGISIIFGATWWNTTNKRPSWPDRPNDDEKPDGEPWPKDNKGSCIRIYAKCVNYGWKGVARRAGQR